MTEFEPNGYARNADEALVQQIAEAYWAAATSENRDMAFYQSPTYNGLKNALIGSIATAYHMPRRRARAVRNLVAEYGPHDSLQGTSAGSRGVRSYVEFALMNPERDFG